MTAEDAPGPSALHQTIAMTLSFDFLPPEHCPPLKESVLSGTQQ
jgi:hypothetical protein